MSYQNYSELRTEVLRFIGGEIDLRSLEEWYTPRMEEFLVTGSPEEQLIGEIEMGLVEIDSGDIDESDLRERLQAYIDHLGYVVMDMTGLDTVVSAASNFVVSNTGININADEQLISFHLEMMESTG